MVKRLFFLLVIMSLTLMACSAGGTGDSRDDAQAAQAFLPALTGFTTYETDSITDAVATALGSASAVTGNAPGAVLFERIDTLIDCYREVGAVDARIYVQQIDVSNVAVPLAGVVAVVNQNRVRNNFLGCITQTPLDGVFGAQSVVEPCTSSGTFTSGGDTISYIYAATNTPLCDQFERHFSRYQG
ncbi:MAG: hypothetical protein OHK0046_45140 [Anaerolineae bacterium]